MTFDAYFEWKVHADVMALVLSAGTFTDERFEEMFDALETHRVRCALTVGPGDVSMSSTQRRRAVEVFKKNGVSVVAVTDSRLTRGIITAVSWMGMDIQAFPFSEMDKAIANTGASGSTQRALKADLEEMLVLAKRHVRPAS